MTTKTARRRTFGSSPHPRALAALVSASLALGAGATARADDAADTATARALGVEGVALADAGRCRDAIDKLARAEKLHPAPTTAGRLGECEIAIGQLVRGTERLRRVVREGLGPSPRGPTTDGHRTSASPEAREDARSNPAFVAAVARARRVLDEALPRIATLHVTVSAPAGAKVSLAIDGERLPDGGPEVDRRIDPGSHDVQASARGYLSATTTTVLSDGETRSVALELVPDPDAPPEPPATPSAADTAAPPDLAPSGGGGAKVAAAISFGVAALGLGAGVYAATVVDRKTATLSSRCGDDRVCPPELRHDITDAKRWATVSTVGFATAGVGVATAIVLLLTSGGSSSSSSSAAAAGGARGVVVRPSIGATSLGLDGRF
jgi:hypothetical protein